MGAARAAALEGEGVGPQRPRRVQFSRAEDPHNLWLVREDGTGLPYWFGEEPSGAVVAGSPALTKGRWTLFCSLTGHEAAGMGATLTVD